MAVNKNFVVKNGLEVATDVILANATTKNVGIGSTQPEFTLDVSGGIGVTHVSVTGFTTLSQDLQVGTSGSTFYVSETNNSVGIGTSVPDAAYALEVRSPVSTGQTAIYVYGDMRVTGDLNIDDINLDAATIQNLNVTGLSTFVGFSTFSDYVFIQDGLNVAGVVTATTFVGDGQIGVGSEGSFVGTAATMIDFKSTNGLNTVDLSSGIATVTIQSGASIGLVIALGG
tara:strand:- start:610 stop:1293 length:684 start_codon:yes stop_codon:yes gene_type:complete